MLCIKDLEIINTQSATQWMSDNGYQSGKLEVIETKEGKWRVQYGSKIVCEIFDVDEETQLTKTMVSLVRDANGKEFYIMHKKKDKIITKIIDVVAYIGFYFIGGFMFLFQSLTIACDIISKGSSFNKPDRDGEIPHDLDSMKWYFIIGLVSGIYLYFTGKLQRKG